MTTERPGSIGLPTSDGDLFPVLPLRDIVVFPAYDRAAFRRPREIHPCARRGDARGEADPARHPAESQRGRAQAGDAVQRRHAGLGAAAPETARRHRQGAGRRRRAGRDPPLHRQRILLRGACPPAARGDRRHGRGRGAGALGDDRVRELREAQQEDLARGGRRGRPDRRLCQGRRHGRLAPCRQDRREAGASWRCRRWSSGWSACSA